MITVPRISLRILLILAPVGLGQRSAADVIARNGIAITTASTINGVSPVAAVNGLSVVGGGSFSPTDIPNLLVWLKADDLVLSDGDPVATWSDASGHGNDATQATSAKRPVYKVNIINGKPVVRTDGVDDWLSGSVSVTGTVLTVVYVGTMISSGSADYARFLSLGVSGTVDYGSALYAAALCRRSTNQSVSAYRNSADMSEKAITYGTPFVAISVFDGTVQTTFVDGQGATPVASTGTFGISNYGLANHILGSTTEVVHGDIGEVLVYARGLSTGERQNLEDYLGARWGITVTH